MKLVLAEKPSVGKELARVLGASSRGNYCEGNGYVVTWSLGHLLTLKMPEQYHPEWAQWSFDTLPLIPKHLETTPLKETRRQLAVVKQLARRSDITEGIIATDAGREGELVARYIFNYLNFNKPLKRLWISSQTDAAIKAGFANLKPASDYEDLYQAALARAEADWLIGLNVTRALTVKYHDSLAAGRVQTPTLAFVASQQQKINQFRPQTYQTLSIATKFGPAHLSRQLDEKQAQQLKTKLAGQPLTVSAVKVKQITENPPLPFDLNELQQAANQRFGYSPKQTLNYLQRLYEREKIVTYPRTDSRYLTADLKDTIPARLNALARYDKEAAKSAAGAKLPNYVYNDAKVGDHYGLIPTEEPVDPARLDNDEMKIFRLIADRFLDLLKPAFQAEQRTYTLTCQGENLTLKITSVQAPGFKGETNQPAAAVKPLKTGDAISGSVKLESQMTKPPALLNEASLLGKMDQYGLGTPATRADIIDKLQNSGLMAKRGRDLSVTPKGQQLLKLVNPQLVSPDLTASWEKQLQAIEKGQVTRSGFITTIKKAAGDLVLEIKQSTADYQDPNLTQKICPDCGSRLRERSTKQGVLLVCSNPTCHYRRDKEPRATNHRCSRCHNKMVILEGARGRYFKCTHCGNTEAMTAAKGKGQKRMNKQEEQRLLKKYSDDEGEQESPLAAAMKAAMAAQNKK